MRVDINDRCHVDCIDVNFDMKCLSLYIDDERVMEDYNYSSREYDEDVLRGWAKERLQFLYRTLEEKELINVIKDCLECLC